MGVLRLLLAISVMLAHSKYSGVLLNGSIAVELFYIISGYYMAMVLNTKYDSKKQFWINRFIKIYGIYWISLLVVTILNFDVWVKICNLDSALIRIWLIFSNLFIFGLDSMMFSTYEGGVVLFVNQFYQHDFKFYQYMLIPQAWSLSLEVAFYLIIPFIVKRKYIMFILFCLSLFIKLMLITNHHNYDPWSYRFFPAEFFLFLTGSYAYIFRNIIKRFYSSTKIQLYIFWLLILIFNMVKIDQSIKNILMYVLLFVNINYLFKTSAKSLFDRRLGELSYPFYLIHVVVLKYMPFLLALPVTIGLSFVIDKIYVKKITCLKLNTNYGGI